MTEREIPSQVWQLDAASLSDANKGLRILPRELRPYSRGIRMVGRTVTVAASGPRFPAAVTTTMPACQARITAWLSGSDQ